MSQGTLAIKIPFLGAWTFTPQDVFALEKCPDISKIDIFLTGEAVEIKHGISAYPSRLIFMTTLPAADLIDKIHETGFQEQAMDFCLNCGKQMREDEDKCSFCGWTYQTEG